MMEYLIVCPLVFLAGLVDSIAGGGGLISLPGYLIAGVPAHMALGTNKLSSTVGTVVSTARLARQGYLKGKLSMAAAASVAAMAGSAIGAHAALLVSDEVIRHMMIVVLPVVAFYVLRKKDGDEGKENTLSRPAMTAIAVGAAFFIGCYDGFYGPDTRSASAQTKVINLSSNVAALITFIISGNVNYHLGLAAALCSVGGHYLGSGLVISSGQRIVRPLILVVLSILFLKILTGG